VVEAWGQFRSPKEGERPPLEAGTRGQMKRKQIEKTKCVVVNCRMCELAIVP
jgi:hypothetical protein